MGLRKRQASVPAGCPHGPCTCTHPSPCSCEPGTRGFCPHLSTETPGPRGCCGAGLAPRDAAAGRGGHPGMLLRGGAGTPGSEPTGKHQSLHWLTLFTSRRRAQTRLPRSSGLPPLIAAPGGSLSARLTGTSPRGPGHLKEGLGRARPGRPPQADPQSGDQERAACSEAAGGERSTGQ